VKLLIFPGGGNPSHQKYKGAYDLLKGSAPQYGYDEVDISVRWPGHHKKDERPIESLTFGGAVNVATAYLEQHEQQEEYFDVLARSFGTLVATKCVIDNQPTKLRKIILWGVPPYWLSWKVWKQDLDENKRRALSKGLHIEDSFFSTLIPFEAMLPQLSYPTIIAGGRKDKRSPPSFLKYLKSLVSEHQDVSFPPVVDGASHVVDNDSPSGVKEEYMETLLLDT
jgi:pimeloyl-ACP methyl ester carboxylesterase